MDLDMWNGSNLGWAMDVGIAAITAKEAGLIGTTFTTADYQTLTGPMDAVLAMPSGY